jgi:hypothetical protein
MATATEISIPPLKIEYDPEGGPDQEILLEQEWGGESYKVGIHPIQVHYLAELLGLLPPSDLEAARTIARLCRQMRKLQERIDHLDTLLLHAAEKGHEDLTEETAYSAATLDIISEYVMELPDAGGDRVESDSIKPAPGGEPGGQLPLSGVGR